MSTLKPGISARQERVQPSLWDRLVDELPGVLAETDSLRQELRRELGRDIDLDQIVQGGARAVEQQTAEMDNQVFVDVACLWLSSTLLSSYY